MTYRTRLADARLTELLAEFPAVVINGPRAAGKTTTARQFANEAVSLDSPADSAAFRVDPDDTLRGRKEPLLLDERQGAPDVLRAVRRAVDADSRPGRFTLTKSIRAELKNRGVAGNRPTSHGSRDGGVPKGRVASEPTKGLLSNRPLS